MKVSVCDHKAYVCHGHFKHAAAPSFIILKVYEP